MQVGGRLLMPGSGMLELFLAAGSTLASDAKSAVTVSSVALSSPFGLDTSQAVTGQVKLDPEGSAEISSQASAGRPQTHCTAHIVQSVAQSGVPHALCAEVQSSSTPGKHTLRESSRSPEH